MTQRHPGEPSVTSPRRSSCGVQLLVLSAAPIKGTMWRSHLVFRRVFKPLHPTKFIPRFFTSEQTNKILRMAPATRSQSRKTRSAGAEVSGALPQALPEKQKKKSTAPKKTSKKRESPKQNEITADIETPTADGSPEHTQKKQKLMDEDAVDISPSSGSDSSPIADSGKELSSSEDATPESSEEVNGETPEIKKEAGSGYDSTPIQQPSQLDVKQEEVKPVKQEDIKQENTPQPALYSLKDEPRPSLKPEDLVDKSTLLSGEAAPILERGLFYFFARNKIDVEEASSVNDLQRSYLVLRPYPPSLMPTDEDVKNINNCRVLMFPKKKLPGTRSHEREM